MSYALAAADRAREGIVRMGVVTGVDATAARAKVSFGGETESEWLPWLAERASGISIWAPVTVGEQVLVVSISGDTAQGVIMGSLFSQTNSGAGADGTYKLTVGSSSITVSDSGITITSNGSKITLAAEGIWLNGARIDLN